MNTSIKKILSYCILIACINWASQQSEKERPPVNFEGELLDAANETFTVENITIGGLYKKIPFYKEHEQSSINPESNTTFLDLAEIAEISPTNPDSPKKSIISHNKQKYIKIDVKLHDPSQKKPDTYVVETTRRIFCDVRKSTGNIEKRLLFEAVKKLTISKDPHVQESRSTEAVTKKTLAREHQCAEAGKALHQLASEAEKLPIAQKGIISDLVDTVKNWVGGICGTN